MFETTIHWVEGIDAHRLGLMARPRGGESLREEVAGWRRQTVDMVISLLESYEIRELELKAEPSLCAEQGIGFRHFPIPDRGTPASRKETVALVDELHSNLVQGKAVAIHCRAGIGRTGLIAACLLHKLHVPYGEIFAKLSRARGLEVPDTPAQSEWVERYAGNG